MLVQPGSLHQIELEFTVGDGKILALANILEAKRAPGYIGNVFEILLASEISGR